MCMRLSCLLKTLLSFPLETQPVVEWLDHYGSLVWNFPELFCRLTLRAVPVLVSSSSVQGAFISSTLGSFDSHSSPLLTGTKCDFSVVLILISLISDMQYIFIHLLGICISLEDVYPALLFIFNEVIIIATFAIESAFLSYKFEFSHFCVDFLCMKYILPITVSKILVCESQIKRYIVNQV